MHARGALCGLLIGLMIVALHGGIEGFQGGFAMDRAGGACAGTLEAAVGQAIFSLTDCSPALLAVLIGSAIFGALAARTISRPDRQPRAADAEYLRPNALALYAVKHPSAGGGNGVADPRRSWQTP